jgi:hypothetical protein
VTDDDKIRDELDEFQSLTNLEISSIKHIHFKNSEREMCGFFYEIFDKEKNEYGDDEYVLTDKIRVICPVKLQTYIDLDNPSDNPTFFFEKWSNFSLQPFIFINRSDILTISEFDNLVFLSFFITSIKDLYKESLIEFLENEEDRKYSPEPVIHHQESNIIPFDKFLK